MKALTITQPYATLVAIGAKRFETRGWSTSYRGPLAIHAGKNTKPVGGEVGLRALCRTEPFATVLAEAGIDPLLDLPRGALVAVVDLVGCVPTDEVVDCSSSFEVAKVTGVHPCRHERAFGDYSPGRFAWITQGREPIVPPAPVRGKQGLWEWEL